MKGVAGSGRIAALGAVGALIVGAMVAGGAHAQKRGAEPGQAALLSELSACPKIAQDAARLACYDKAANALIQAETKGEVVVVDRQQAREVRRQAFGFQIPSINIFARSGVSKEAVEEAIDRSSAVVASAGRGADGKLLLTTEEGAVWAQTDNLPIDQMPRKGDKVNFVKGAVGSYFCDITKYQSIRCERRK
ncbi:MAG: hypothetical protein ABIO39_12810 [Caulobacteraceae bacterium]